MFILSANDYYEMKENFEKNVKCKYKSCIYGKRLWIDFKTPATCKENWQKKDCLNYIYPIFEI